MKTIGDRISLENHGSHTTLIISTKIERWKETLMLTWIVAWTFCGTVFLYYLFGGDLIKDEKLIVFIVFLFWMYFEYRIVKTFLWRKFGVEFIRIDEDKFSIKKAIKSYGKVNEYYTQQIDIKKVECLKQDPKSFSKVMNDSFWIIGEGAVRFEDKGDFIYFGHQLESEESEKLAKEVRKVLKKYKRN